MHTLSLRVRLETLVMTMQLHCCLSGNRAALDEAGGKSWIEC